MPASSSPAADTPSPDSNWRALVSLGLVIHFFGVGLALASYTAASPLEQRMLEVLPYLRWLDFDFTHVYPSPARLHQTHALEGDVDFSCQVIANLKDGSKVSVDLPPPNLWPGERARRYQSLINVMGNAVAVADIETALPAAIAGSVLRAHGAKHGEIRITGHTLPSMEALGSTSAELRDPKAAVYLRNAYERKVIVGKDSVILQKAGAAFEVAPVERGVKPADAKKTPPRQESKP